MYLFHLYGYYLFAIIIINYIFSLSSTIAIHQSKHQMMDHFNTMHGEQQQLQKRYRRFLFPLVANTNNHKEYKAGDHSPMVVNDGEHSATATTKNLLQNLGDQTNRVFQGATDTILTPFKWLSNLIRYWPLYLICGTIIFGLITFFYCSCQSKIAHLFSHQKYDPMTLVRFFRQKQQQQPDQTSLPQLN